MPAVEAENGAIDVSFSRPFKEVKKGYTGFLEQDVLFAKITPCMENGKMAVVPKLINDIGFGSTEFHVIRARTGLSPKYIYYYVSSKAFRIDAEHSMTGAVGQKRVPINFLSNYKIPTPPLNEQHRIVAKIEELFSELDNGIAALKTAREQLKVYRQAVLKHAFEGKLTAQWRKENADKLETPEQLLARIQQERETRYQQQLTDWQQAVKEWEANGKKGKKPGKPNKISRAQLLSMDEQDLLAALPQGWCWLKVGQLCDVVRGGSPRPAGDSRYYDGDIPFLKVADLTRTDGLYVNRFTYTIKPAGLLKTRLICPDTLIISNSGATLGVPKICTINATFNDGIAAFIGLAPEELKYHYFFWSSKTADLRSINQGAAQPNLNTDLIKDVVIPVCHPEEMMIVATAIEEILSIQDRILSDIDTQLLKAETLRQSILKKAFSGQLVPQDPNDEPASVLLARIQAERVAVSAQPDKACDTRKRKTKGAAHG
jgi:type I restriction enzyme S subunit